MAADVVAALTAPRCDCGRLRQPLFHAQARFRLNAWFCNHCLSAESPVGRERLITLDDWENARKDDNCHEAADPDTAFPGID